MTKEILMPKTYRSFEEFQREFAKNSKKILKELKKHLPKVAEMMEADILKRTRLGYGVDKNYGSKEALAKLADSYKAQRRRLKKSGKLSSKTSVSKSNLTKSGSMLDSLNSKIDKNKMQITVKPEGIDKDGVSNRDKARWAQEGSTNRPKRPFLYLSTPEIKRIREFLRKELDKIINKLL